MAGADVLEEDALSKMASWAWAPCMCGGLFRTKGGVRVCTRRLHWERRYDVVVSLEAAPARGVLNMCRWHVQANTRFGGPDASSDFGPWWHGVEMWVVVSLIQLVPYLCMWVVVSALLCVACPVDAGSHVVCGYGWMAALHQYNNRHGCNAEPVGASSTASKRYVLC
jgi:hypothetical protein